jgi:Nuclease-related domain
MWAMLKKPRLLSDEIKVLRILKTRGALTDEETRHLYVLEKGYEGEVKFDSLTEKLENENLIVNDLLLESNHSTFQIDSLLVYQKPLYLIDVKNHEGDYCFKSDGFYTITGIQSKDPLAQLKRCELLLRQLLHKYGYSFPIESYLVFINPEFTLYHAPEDPQIILPSQVNRFMNKLNTLPSKLTDRHNILADLLISMHQPKNPFVKLPAYDYDHLGKGLMCCSCHSFELIIGKSKLTCKACGCVERVESAVLRCVEEIGLLFPDKKITTSLVYEWSGGIVSEKMIRRLLQKNYEAVHMKRFTHYL